jgi:hypothetical protein
MAKYKYNGEGEVVIPNVGLFKTGDITPEIDNPIFNPDFEEIKSKVKEEDKPAPSVDEEESKEETKK